MDQQWIASSWVASHQDRIDFALQALTVDTREDPHGHLLAAGRLAEELGFDAFFTGDHPAWLPEPWVHLAALAVTTHRIRLGTNVTCFAYRPPLLTARLAADVDNLSRGRVILGMGAGWDENEFVNFGLEFPSARERQEALEEAITVIRGAWGDDPIDFEGRTYRAHQAHIHPPPVQQPGPPLLLAGGGEKVTLRQVARYADACSLSTSPVLSGAASGEGIRHKLAVLHQYCEEIGRPYDTILRTHFTGWLILAETEAAVQAKVRHYLPGGVKERFSGRWRDWVVAATPERAAGYFQELVRAGIQYFIVEMLDAADVETIRLLASEVVPPVKAAG